MPLATDASTAALRMPEPIGIRCRPLATARRTFATDGSVGSPHRVKLVVGGHVILATGGHGGLHGWPAEVPADGHGFSSRRLVLALCLG